jgi:3-dehydroquinate dehydratase-2
LKKTVLILNGPGLGDLSGYDSKLFGSMTLENLADECQVLCDDLGIGLDFRQTDNQDEMFRWIAKDSEEFDGVIINPIGHSPAMIQMFELYRSAIQMIASLKKPVIEVHITNIYRQVEEVTQPLHEPAGEMGFICGFGKLSYLLGIRAMARKLNATANA